MSKYYQKEFKNGFFLFQLNLSVDLIFMLNVKKPDLFGEDVLQREAERGSESAD